MPTFEQLRKEIQDEKDILKFREDREMIHAEKRKLEAELRHLRHERKYGKQIRAIKPVISGVKTAFNKIGKVVGEMAEEQSRRERQEKAIRKKGFIEPRRSLFG